MPRKSLDSDVDARPAALHTMGAFNELLGKLRSIHEEVCARNAVLEGQPAQCASQRTLSDPWLPINFYPPMDDPVPRRLPWSMSSHHSPRALDVRQIDILVTQQERLCQGIDGLIQQQQHLGEQLTQVATKCPVGEQLNLTVKAMADGLGKQQELLCQGLDGLVQQQEHIVEQLAQVATTHHSVSPKAAIERASLVATTHHSASAKENLRLTASLDSTAYEHGPAVQRFESTKSQYVHNTKSEKLRMNPKKFKKLGSSSTKEWRSTVNDLGDDQLGELNTKETHIMRKLSHLVHGHAHGLVFDVLIFLNCLLMAFELQYHGMNYGSKHFGMKGSIDVAWADNSLQVIDWFFGIVFAVELIVNLLVHRLAFFVRPAVVLQDDSEVLHSQRSWENKGSIGTKVSSHKSICSRFNECCSRIDLWGLLDFFVVFFWIFYRISSAGLPFDPMVLKLARLAKLLRMLKLVKIVSSFDSLYLLTTTIQGSISALAWSGVLLLVVQALLSFLMCQQLSMYCEDTSQTLEDRKEIWLYFGTYTRALFTMFELTLGNWVPVGRALMDKISMWFFIFSLMHKLIIGFAVVNVMNGVFMQTTFKIAATDDRIMIRQRERGSKIHRQKMSNLFHSGDRDGTGFLTREAFADLAVDPAFRKWMASMELSIFKEDDVDAVFGLIAGEDHKISLDEFVKETSRLKGPARTIDIELRFQELRDAMAYLIMTKK